MNYSGAIEVVSVGHKKLKVLQGPLRQENLIFIL